MKKLSKTEAQKQISDFFSDIKNKTPKQVKKIKKLAMKNSIQLKDLRKKFCKKCLTPYDKPKIRIKSNIKSVTCSKCDYISKWKVN
ncbi:hypothetical protein BMS3Abin17_01121 [archaeon BMS3Abin17]|nr:hypothetical protein BMS3Abin17_01121 [archaeon BMS3Abin17]HDZ60657.1 hypothetical protein [Candidatus Pacearchaeota archaeon]